jgi:hypothetical protein
MRINIFAPLTIGQHPYFSIQGTRIATLARGGITLRDLGEAVYNQTYPETCIDKLRNQACLYGQTFECLEKKENGLQWQ